MQEQKQVVAEEKKVLFEDPNLECYGVAVASYIPEPQAPRNTFMFGENYGYSIAS